MLLWILAVLGLIAIWVVGWYFAIALTWKLVLTALVICAVAGVLVFRRWRAARAAKALESALLEQASQQAKNARPDRRAEILELQQRFE